jgi:membrane-associated protease RseP (regulator of RpoE activity)
MIRTVRTGAFDVLARFKRTFIAYADVGIFLTVLSGLGMTILLISTAFLTMLTRPEPSPVLQPQNLLLIPGINDYVPSTFAVWFALVLAIVIHEFGHGLLSRVEGIRVKYTGILMLVIPIGAFVEPDETEIERSALSTKLRMFAAGITNNLVIGIICILGLVVLLGMVVPGSAPYIQGVYEDYPAYHAGILPGTVVLAIDGIPVSDFSDVSAIMENTTAGQMVSVLGEYQGEQQMYDVTLSAVPPEVNTQNTDSGFMGVVYAQPQTVTAALHAWTHPSSPLEALVSALQFVVLPFSSIAGNSVLGILVVDTPDPAFLSSPFPLFWEVVHLLYWCAWINILLGTFNALPIGPLDGGQMLREWARSFFGRRGKERYALLFCRFVTNLLIIMIVIPLIMPFLFR